LKETMSADPVLSSKSILDRLSLSGKNALVTGGNKGIGRAIAHAYAQAGANVAIIGRNENDSKAVSAEIASLYKGIKVINFTCDVTVENEVNATIDAVAKEFGSLEIACNNAGIAEWVDAQDMTFASWKKMISNNLDSAFLCAQAQAKYMIKQGYGKIVFTALDDLKKTEIGQKYYPEWISRIPMKVMGEVTDMQGAAVYLSSEASDYATGMDLVIDGGYLAW